MAGREVGHGRMNVPEHANSEAVLRVGTGLGLESELEFPSRLIMVPSSAQLTVFHLCDQSIACGIGEKDGLRTPFFCSPSIKPFALDRALASRPG